MKTETLCANEWLSLHVVRAPEHNVGGYVYSHETRCQGRIVAVLPYRVTSPAGWPQLREYLLRSEVTPCWDVERPVLSAITGGYEGGAIEDDAVREVREETGYEIKREELIPLGESYASKSSDTVYSLFSVDLTDREPTSALFEETPLDGVASAVWVTADRLAEIPDPQVSVMHLRLGASAASVPSAR